MKTRASDEILLQVRLFFTAADFTKKYVAFAKR
jgi:hypothetical protein